MRERIKNKSKTGNNCVNILIKGADNKFVDRVDKT